MEIIAQGEILRKKEQSKQPAPLNDSSNFSLQGLIPLDSELCLHLILFLDALQSMLVMKWVFGRFMGVLMGVLIFFKNICF